MMSGASVPTLSRLGKGAPRLSEIGNAERVHSVSRRASVVSDVDVQRSPLAPITI